MRAASPAAEAQRSLKTEQRALRGPSGSADCLSPIRSARQRAERSDLPVMPAVEYVYPAASQAWQLFVEVPFTESLILAQDERWRRA